VLLIGRRLFFVALPNEMDDAAVVVPVSYGLKLIYKQT
jgi:hypothetical protein